MHKRSIKIFFLFFVFTLFFSCENDEELLKDITFVDCNSCTADEPFNADIRMKLSDPYKLGSANEIVFIDVYEGNLEDEVLFTSYQTTSTETTINLPINKKYCVTATYYIDNKTYIAVNSVTPRVKYNENSCDEPCYYTAPRSLNLRIKHIK